MDAALRDEMPPLPSQVRWLADAVRALLAAGPEAPPPPSDAVREAAERVAALAEHQTNQRGTPFVTLWGQEGVDAMSALRRVLAALSRTAAKGGE